MADAPTREEARLSVLREYRVLDSLPEEEFDDLTHLAAHLCGVPIALLTLVDRTRQRFKSRVGLAATTTSRDVSLCAEAMTHADVFVISDAARDPHFAAHPLVTGEPHLRFYAAAPLVSPEGQPLGALCVIDREPRDLPEEHKETLRVLARHAMTRLEMRRRRAAPSNSGWNTNIPDDSALTDVIESTSDAFIALDAGGRFSYVNEKAAHLFNRASADLVGRQLWTEAPECVGQQQFDTYRRVQDERVPTTTDLYFPALDRWLENRMYPIPAGLAVFLRDVTERKRTEALSAGQNQLLELIARGAPLRQALTELLKFLEAQSADMLCSALLIDETGTRVRTGAAPSLPPEFSRAIDDLPIGPSAGSCGTAAFRCEAVFVEDIATDPLWENYRAFALPHGLRACWSTPIFDAQRHVLGTFAIYYRQPTLPTPWHQRLIEVATHIASIAISWDRAQAGLRRSEERYRTTLDGILEGCQLIGFDWRYLYLNDAAAKHNRRPNHELLGRTMMEAWPGIEATPVFAMLRHCLTDRVALHEEIDFVFADGVHGWYDVRCQAVPEGIFVLSIDITERKRADAALRESEARLREAQRDARIGSWRYLPDGRFTWSDEMYELFHLSRHVPLTCDAVLKRIHPDDRETQLPFKQALAAGARGFQSEFRIVWPDGTILTVFSRGRINRDVDGAMIDAVGTVQDISERKHAEQQLEASHAAMRELASHLQTVREEQSTQIAREIHDVLGQQLTGLKLDLAWMRRRVGTSSDETLKQALADKLRETVSLVDSTMSSVQKIARELRPGTLDKLGLAVALESETREFASRAGLRWRCDIASPLPRLASNVETTIFRIVQEALTNVARHAKASEVSVSVRWAPGGLEVEIRDNGRGYDARNVETKSLGLLGMRERARLLGGRVEIRGESGVGTSVTLHVPLPHEISDRR